MGSNGSHTGNRVNIGGTGQSFTLINGMPVQGTITRCTAFDANGNPTTDPAQATSYTTDADHAGAASGTGQVYRVSSGASSGRQVTLTQDAGFNGASCIAWSSRSYSDGILFAGDGAVRRADIESWDSAETMILAGYGSNHLKVLDASRDTAPYGFVLGQQQLGCFAGLDVCLSSDGSHLYVTIAGVRSTLK